MYGFQKDDVYAVETIETHHIIRLYEAKSKSMALDMASLNFEPIGLIELKDKSKLDYCKVDLFNNYLKEVIVETEKNNASIFIPNWMSFKDIGMLDDNKYVVCIKDTLKLYADAKVIDYWDLEICNDSTLYETPIKNLFDTEWLYKYFRDNSSTIYTSNRNGEYPL